MAELPAQNSSTSTGPPRDPLNPPILLELLCPACKNVLNRPKQLSYCGHVFCADCLQQIAKPAPVVKPGLKPMSIECPVCLMSSHLSNGLQSLRTNLPLFNITEMVRAYEKLYLESKAARVSGSSARLSLPPRNNLPCCPDYLINIPRVVCTHCNIEICSICEPKHTEEIRKNTMELGKDLILKLAKLAEQLESIVARSEFLKNAFSQSVDTFSNQVANSVSESFSPLTRSLKSEAADLIGSVRARSLEMRDRLVASLEKWKDTSEQKQHFAFLAGVASGAIENDTDVTQLFSNLRDLDSEIEFVLGFSSSDLPQWEFSLDQDLASKVNRLSQNLSLGTSTFKMAPLPETPDELEQMELSDEEGEEEGFRVHTPPPPSSSEDTQLSVIPPPHEAIPTPAPTPYIPSFENLEPYGKTFYDNLSAVKTFSGEDCLGNELRKPTGSCLISSEFFDPMVAVIHNSRRVSIFSLRKLEATFEIQQPAGEKGNVYLGWDIACDSSAGYLFVTCHRRTRILTFSITSTEWVVPNVFARTSEPDRFYGLAISNKRKEIFSALKTGITAFGLEDSSCHFFIPFPATIQDCSVQSVFRFSDSVNVIFSYLNGRKLHSFKLPIKGDLDDEIKSQIGERYSNVEAYEDEQAFQAVAIDPVGSVVIFDGVSKQLQVFTRSGHLLSSMPFFGRDPSSFTILPPYQDRPPALAVTNSSANDVTFLTIPIP